ncbi:MinD/ParA family ATP-binding protein [Mycetocola zhadangensis]|uniref:MinD/ParA family protein n=1 Tax=Mycetocola zhadangensis TaxID=1164595 RepID=A0A3L7J6R8_9MICO|nr:MinD/ParA family protein [Mycetocola zhadangensis]RLQ86306.1 MinD/ParA family protein [Mycetocola zhadangensis]GGE90049.1 ATPase [Mycetocola zhadangensis]
MAPTQGAGGSARHSGDRSGKDVAAEPVLSSADTDTASIDPIDAVSSRATVSVQLPAAPIHDIPEDEQAVAIDDVAVQPDYLEAGTEPSTESVVLHAPVPTPEVQPAPVSVSARRSEKGGPESSDLLTSERLLEGTHGSRTPPEGFWRKLVYDVSGQRVHLGDSAEAAARKDLDERIRKHFHGGARFVPVLTRKGGVGKTTVTALLGMALADTRDDRIIAIDANPDRGTLSERIARHTDHTVRDVVRDVDSIHGYNEFSTLVARDETRLDVLASDTDPLLSEAFNADDYDIVADIASQYYSLVLTDCGTGIVHSVMGATLRRADAVVIVSGSSVDEARLASETLTWLERNGYEHLVSNAIVALNTATQGSHMVNLGEIESHFKSRVREIVRIPYDPQLAAGSAISFKDLKPVTRHAARTLAALVVAGMPTTRPTLPTSSPTERRQ